MVLFLFFPVRQQWVWQKNTFRLPSKIHASRALSGNLVNDGILECSRFCLLMKLLSFQEFFLKILNKHTHTLENPLTIPLFDSQKHHHRADEKHSSYNTGRYHVHLLLQRERENKHVEYIYPPSTTARIQSILSLSSIFNL